MGERSRTEADRRRAALSALGPRELSGHVEELVAEEHRLWQAAELGHLDKAGQDLLTAVRDELDRTWDAIRRRRARPTGELYGLDVPDPPNDLDGPDPEPPHLERGGAHPADRPAPDPGINPNVP